MGIPRGIDMTSKIAKIRAFLGVLRYRVDKLLELRGERLKLSSLREDGGASWVVAFFILLVLIVFFVIAMDRMGITLQQVISDFEKFFGTVMT
jgi:hypothetical protein